MKYRCQKWVIDTVVCNYCFKYWATHLELGLKFRNANTKCFSSVLSVLRHLKTYVVCCSMQSHPALLAILFTVVHRLFPCENILEREGGERLENNGVCRGLKEKEYLKWCFQPSNWCDSFCVPLTIFYIVILIKYLRTACPRFNIWWVRC